MTIKIDVIDNGFIITWPSAVSQEVYYEETWEGVMKRLSAHAKKKNYAAFFKK